MDFTSPYSFSYTACTQDPGSLPRFRTGTNAAPRRKARGGPRRNPRASRPTTASIFGRAWIADVLASSPVPDPLEVDATDDSGSEGITVVVIRCIKCVRRVSKATGSRRIGRKSRKVMPYMRSMRLGKNIIIKMALTGLGKPGCTPSSDLSSSTSAIFKIKLLQQ